MPPAPHGCARQATAARILTRTHGVRKEGRPGSPPCQASPPHPPHHGRPHLHPPPPTYTLPREEEGPELADLLRKACAYDVPGGVDNKANKANVLIQVRRWAKRARGHQ